MNIRLDENLPYQLVQLLTDLGHDVDTSLASLFECAARSVSPDAEGLARARSATEAFFFRRLESLPETEGGRAARKMIHSPLGK